VNPTGANDGTGNGAGIVGTGLINASNGTMNEGNLSANGIEQLGNQRY